MEHLEQLMIDMKESLEREMRSGFDRLAAQIAGLSTSFDTQAERFDRHMDAFKKVIHQLRNCNPGRPT